MRAEHEIRQSYPLADTFIERAKDPAFIDVFSKGVPIPILLGQPVSRELPLLPSFRRSMAGILDDISSFDFDPTKSFFEYQIDGEVEQDDIARLVRLPYEVSIVEVNGELVFRTGEPRKAHSNDKDMRQRQNHTRLFFHSHPVVAGRRVQANAPSFPDLRLAARSAATNVIASEEGLFIFGQPERDPLTGENYNGKTHDLIIKYCREMGIDYYDTIPDSDESLRDIYGLSEEEKLLLQKQFADKSGAIKSRASWNDKAIASIIEVINKRGQEEPVNPERVEETRRELDNPHYLPTVDEVYDAFGGIDDFGLFRLTHDWYSYANSQRYEVLTQEYVSALGIYLADRVKQYGGNVDQPLRILEIGAGDGRLSYFLNFYLQAHTPGQASIIATDREELTQGNFPVEIIDYEDAVQKYKPTIIINSWMPLGQDWTSKCRKAPGVQEIILIGDEGACGTPEAWEEDSSFTRSDLPDLEAVQINKTQNPSTVSLRG